MKVRSVIFDLDGTLLNTLEMIKVCNNEVFKKHGFPERTLSEYRRCIGYGMKNLLKKALPEGTSDDIIERLVPEVIEIYHEKGAEMIPPYEGINEVLDTLVEKDVKISILTNKEHSYAIINARSALSKYNFETVIGERPGMPIKPDPSGVFEIAEITGIPLTETVFVGDMTADIFTGKNAGIFTVGCLWGFGDKTDLENAGADMLIEHPLELLKIID